mmetsp:Transcript_1623/g.2219  ORF Transcript_1623/g.2219 Transcript_1623/m.2219 type:complete len:210 (+) Transcript_1623:280-909(+)
MILRPPGWKKSENSAILSHPRCLTSGVSCTLSLALSRAWKSSARGSWSTISGISEGAVWIRSVMRRVLLLLCNIATSSNSPGAWPPRDLRGPRTRCDTSSLHGTSPSSELRGSAWTLRPKKSWVRSRRPSPEGPRATLSKSKGNEYWSGATQSCALANSRANGPAATLCSMAAEPSTIYLIGPCSSSSSRTSARHSGVGLTGQKASKPP